MSQQRDDDGPRQYSSHGQKRKPALLATLAQKAAILPGRQPNAERRTAKDLTRRQPQRLEVMARRTKISKY